MRGNKIGGERFADGHADDGIHHHPQEKSIIPPMSAANRCLKRRIAKLGDTVFASSPDEFGKHIFEYADKWAKVIRAVGIKL
jgi:hypothetical protein